MKQTAGADRTATAACPAGDAAPGDPHRRARINPASATPPTSPGSCTQRCAAGAARAARLDESSAAGRRAHVGVSLRLAGAARLGFAVRPDIRVPPGGHAHATTCRGSPTSSSEDPEMIAPSLATATSIAGHRRRAGRAQHCWRNTCRRLAVARLRRVAARGARCRIALARLHAAAHRRPRGGCVGSGSDAARGAPSRHLRWRCRRERRSTVRLDPAASRSARGMARQPRLQPPRLRLGYRPPERPVMPLRSTSSPHLPTRSFEKRGGGVTRVRSTLSPPPFLPTWTCGSEIEEFGDTTGSAVPVGAADPKRSTRTSNHARPSRWPTTRGRSRSAASGRFPGFMPRCANHPDESVAEL